jgi:hypothetical protein
VTVGRRFGCRGEVPLGEEVLNLDVVMPGIGSIGGGMFLGSRRLPKAGTPVISLITYRQVAYACLESASLRHVAGAVKSARSGSGIGESKG